MIPEEKANTQRMVKVVSDNIISALGMTSAQNYAAVKALSCMTSSHSEETFPGIMAPAMVSMLDRGIINAEAQKEGIPGNFTFFETIVTLSIIKALKGSGIDPKSPRVGFVISSTKGNVSLLDLRNDLPETTLSREDRSLLGTSARMIAGFFGNPNVPIVVSNACISGVCAQILAARQIEDGIYDSVIVSGADEQSLFIVSGFQSFKALSQTLCRPFDKDRDGLNLGEAAATLILSSSGNGWSICCGAVRNDANHISGPSRTGEGSYRAIASALGEFDPKELAFINVHGTSTVYNDEMESIAIERAGLIGTPVNALKGNFGHTMGSAGVLESIISMKAVEDGTILPTKGYSECGVSYPVNVSPFHRQTERKSFLKLMSGFGGCNASVLFTLGEHGFSSSPCPSELRSIHRVRITPESITLDSMALEAEGRGKELLDNAFRKYIGSYPKYFKMDTLSRLGFVASELLLKDEPGRFIPRDDRAVVFLGSTSSLCNDRNYQKTIQTQDDYYPSPALFVYTLPNIVTGEIAIRNKYYSETSFFILDRKDKAVADRTIRETFMDPSVHSAIAGWLDCRSDDEFEAEIELLERKKIITDNALK